MNHHMIKKHFFFLCAAFLMAASCAEQVPEKGALILGHATGLDPEDTVVAILFQVNAGSGKGIQTDTLRDGHFTFRMDSLPEADYYNIHILRPGAGFANVISQGPEIYLEPGALVRINGAGKHLRTAHIDSPVKDQRLRQRFMKKMSLDDWNAMDDIMAHRNRVMNELYHGEGISQERKDSLRKMAKQDLEASHGISDRLALQELALLEKEEIGAFALHKLNTLAHEASVRKKEYREAVLRVYGRLSDVQKNSWDGMQALNYLHPVETVGVGAPVPSYGYVDKDGKSVRLSDFAAGKWILVDFWSRGCGPCIKSVPELGAVSREFQDRLTVVSICLDQEKGWREASRKHGIFWNDWFDPKGASGGVRAFGMNGLPTFVLVTPEGLIHDITLGYGEGQLRRSVQSALNAEGK